MKKCIAFVLALVCVLCLFGCGRSGHIGSPYYFTGKIIDENEFGCLVEVVDYGNCGFSSEQVILGNTKIGLRYSMGDYLLIEFDGVFLESDPPQLRSATISKTEAP